MYQNFCDWAATKDAKFIEFLSKDERFRIIIGFIKVFSMMMLMGNYFVLLHGLWAGNWIMAACGGFVLVVLFSQISAFYGKAINE